MVKFKAETISKILPVGFDSLLPGKFPSVRDPVLRVVGLGLGGCERGGEFEIGGN